MPRWAGDAGGQVGVRPARQEHETLLAVRGDDPGHRAESFGFVPAESGSAGGGVGGASADAAAARSRSARACGESSVVVPDRRTTAFGGRRPGPGARDPALDVALGAGAHAERARGHVATDDAAGAGVRAVADGHRGDEHVVGARAGVRADGRAVLVDAVVVDGHRRGADVRVLADRRVAHVGQVRDLRAGADLRVLRLDERADLARRRRAPCRAAGRRTARRSRRRRRRARRAVRAHDAGPRADLDVGQRGVGADGRALADHGRAVQLRAGQERDVPLQLDVDVDPRGRRVDDRDALAHPVLEDAAVHLGPQHRQLDAVVDALDQHRVVGPQRAHVAAVGRARSPARRSGTPRPARCPGRAGRARRAARRRRTRRWRS